MTRHNRETLLNEANRLVNGDRNDTYGEPFDDYTKVAGLWNTYVSAVLAKHHVDLDGLQPLEPYDCIAMMILLKVARTLSDPDHRDSWVDIAGYAACAHDARQDQLAAHTIER